MRGIRFETSILASILAGIPIRILPACLLSACPWDAGQSPRPSNDLPASYAGISCNELANRLNKETQEYNDTQPALRFEFPITDYCPFPPATGEFDSLPGPATEISAVQVLSNQSMGAKVSISDHRGKRLRILRQRIGTGACGSAGSRSTADGLAVFYLVWDEKDSSGNAVDDGAYLWEIEFETREGIVNRKIHLGVYRKCPQDGQAPLPD